MKTEDMGKGNLDGVMVESMTEIGWTENNMEKEFTEMLKGRNRKENGQMEKESDGLNDYILICKVYLLII